VIDTARRRLVVEVLLPRAEAIVLDLQMDGLRDRPLREAVAALLAEPVPLGPYAMALRTLRSLGSIPDETGQTDPGMVEAAIRECFDLVLSLA
jgi:hypothetical protein